MDTKYIYEAKYTKDSLKNELKIEHFDKLIGLKVLLYNGNFDKDEETLLFKEKGKDKEFIEVNFVGVLVYDNIRIVSLPKFTLQSGSFNDEGAIEIKTKEASDEEKKEEHILLSLFSKYRKELSTKDPLFAMSSGEFFDDQRIAESLKLLYEEYGRYTKRELVADKHKGRISWSDTVAHKQPIFFNDSPFYSEFIRHRYEDTETVITELEEQILSYYKNNGLIEINFEANVSPVNTDNEEQVEYNKSIIRKEMASVFDDIQLERLNLMNEFFNQKLGFCSEEKKIVLNKGVIIDKLGGEPYNSDYWVRDVSFLGWEPRNDDRYKWFLFLKNGYRFISSGPSHLTNQNIERGTVVDIHLCENKSYWNVSEIIVKSKSDLFTKGSIYAISSFSRLLEVLLADYFAPEKGVFFDMEKGHCSFASSLFSQKIEDMNSQEKIDKNSDNFKRETDLRVYRYTIENEAYVTEEYDSRKGNNYLDVAFDGNDNNHCYCVILDAKAYSLDKNRKHSIPEADSVYKQYRYEDIMERVYRTHSKELEKQKISCVEIYNAFVLPKYKDENGSDNEPVFSIDGYVSDGLRKKTIFILGVDLEKLIIGCLFGQRFKERQQKLIGMIDEKINKETIEQSEGYKGNLEIYKYVIKL